MDIATAKNRILTKQDIGRDHAEWLFLNASMTDLSSLAKLARAQFHQENVASYLIMAIINYTNTCVAGCDYCSFFRYPHQKDSYLLSDEEVFERIDKLVALGGTLIGFNGGFHPKLHIQDYANLFKAIHEKYTKLNFYEMTVAEFMFACKNSKMSYAEGAKILSDHGTKWITGGGAEVLDEDFRKRHSPGKYTVSDYYTAQKAILESGIGSTATMVIGFDETLAERFNHLESLREFQNSTGRKLPSFLCWTYKPWNNKFAGSELSNEEYLRWLAICRIYLNNFKHIRTSILTQNEDGLKGLDYGADDFDLPTEDEVTQKAGANISTEFESILGVAKNMGYKTIMREAFSIAPTL